MSHEAPRETPAKAEPVVRDPRGDRCLNYGAQVQAPVVAGHEVPHRELELARLEQLEAELAADRIRRRVVDVREGMHEALLVVALGDLDRLRGRRHRDAAALEFRHHHPADLVDLLVAPLLRPEAHRGCSVMRGSPISRSRSARSAPPQGSRVTVARTPRSLGNRRVGRSRLAVRVLSPPART